MTLPKQPGLSLRNPARALAWQSTAILLGVLPLAMTWILLVSLWTPSTTKRLAIGVGVSCALALAAGMLRAVTMTAALTGGILAICLYDSTAFSNVPWWRSSLLPLLTLFVLTHTATRFRQERKQREDIAEAKRGRRASQVAANIGIAALIAPVWQLHTWAPEWMPWSFSGAAVLPAILAALAEAAADTVSSEAGQAFSMRPRLVTTWKRVPPGTDGAVSLMGTLAGCIAAAVVVLVSMGVLRLSVRVGGISMGGAIFGLLFDSLLGATLERRGWLNNDAVNFLSTLSAAIAAGWLVSAGMPLR